MRLNTKQNITLVTGNAGKVREVRRYLGEAVEHVDLDLPEIQSLDPREIVREKAWHAFHELGRPVLVEDVSLVFHALGKLPGTLIKWFDSELGHEGLCRLVDGKDRACVATVTNGYCDGGEVIFAEGEMHGTVAERPRGDSQFRGHAQPVSSVDRDQTFEKAGR
ncbi:MAG: non-canonical purine NTP pyrophosphatase [Candidatus Moranbacteria bacterium]|nr:non-canonical purine NTP pyrophosphatase [Candidatus Moranbacteria bacterium]